MRSEERPGRLQAHGGRHRGQCDRPAMNLKLHFKYDEVAFIARTQINPNVIIVNSKASWKNFGELSADLKKTGEVQIRHGRDRAGQPCGSLLIMRNSASRGPDRSGPLRFGGESILASYGGCPVLPGKFEFRRSELKGDGCAAGGHHPERVATIRMCRPLKNWAFRISISSDGGDLRSQACRPT